MKVYGIIFDGGDGSAHMRWYTNKELVDKILYSNDYIDEVGMNEGDPAEILTLPDDLDLAAAGFMICDDDEEYD